MLILECQVAVQQWIGAWTQRPTKNILFFSKSYLQSGDYYSKQNTKEVCNLYSYWTIIQEFFVLFMYEVHIITSTTCHFRNPLFLSLNSNL